MADNVPITAGVGTDIATDDIGGFHHQRVKIGVGDNGAAADVSQIAPMPTRPGHPPTKVLTNAAVSASSSGDNALVSATASQTTRVFAMMLVFHGDTTAKFQSGATDLTGAMQFRAGDKLILDYTGEPWFVTGSNETFDLNLGSAVTVTGFIQYEKSA